MLFSVGPVGGFVAVEVGAACDDDDVGVELSGVTGDTMVELGVPEIVRERQNVWRLSTERIQENMGVLEQLVPMFGVSRRPPGCRFAVPVARVAGRALERTGGRCGKRVSTWVPPETG